MTYFFCIIITIMKFTISSGSAHAQVSATIKLILSCCAAIIIIISSLCFGFTCSPLVVALSSVVDLSKRPNKRAP